MTIEEQFFKTFGIEPFIYCSDPRLECSARSEGTCKKECEYYSGILYPEITAEILLELIRIMNIYQEKSLVYGQTKRELQEDILNRVILMHKKGLGIKREVQEVFGEQDEHI